MKRFLFLILFLLSFVVQGQGLTNQYYGTGYKYWFVGYGGFPVVPLDSTYRDSVSTHHAYPMVWDSTTDGSIYGRLVPSRNLRLNEVSSPTFVSGWTGSGFRLDQNIANPGQSTIEVDNAFVRGDLTVYELIVQRIRADGGILFITSAGKIDSISISGADTLLWFSDPENTSLCEFAANDLIRAQIFSPDGNTIRLVTAKVESVSGRSINVTQYSASKFQVGDNVVRFGNTTNTARQGSLYFASLGSNSPFMDVIDGVNTVSSWSGYDKTKLRIGDINGVISVSHGQLYGYGIWARDNIYLENGFLALSDSGHIRSGKTSYSDNTAGFFLGFDATTPKFNIGNATDYLKWDGTNLSIAGSISIQNPGSINTSDLNNDEGWTQGANWSTNLTNIPSTLQTPSGAGLFLSGTNMGYYNGTTWKTYMDNTGNFYLSGTSGGLTWDAGTDALIITNGTITGGTIQTNASGSDRVVLSSALGSRVDFYSGVDWGASIYSSNPSELVLSSGDISLAATTGISFSAGLGNTITANNAFISTIGFRNGTMTAGRYLRSNGTNFVSNTIQAGDIPDLSGTYLVASHTTTYNHSNYNTAYGWGNHASAGYITSAYNSLVADNKIGAGASQVAAGNHTHSSFTGTIDVTIASAIYVSNGIITGWD